MPAKNYFSKKHHKVMEINEILTRLFPENKCELNYSTPWQFLFAVIMSAQTTDKQVNVLTSTLFKKYNTLDKFANSEIAVLTGDMSSIGLYKGKARNLQATAKILIEKYNYKIPETISQLVELKGVARKTANVYLYEICGINEGMAIDTHIGRMARRLGLVAYNVENAVLIEKNLMKIVPMELWGSFGHRLILYGRYHWPAIKKTHKGSLDKFAISRHKYIQD